MIIGLCGYPQAGKSSVAKILVQEHGFHLLETKHILRELTGLITRMSPDLLKQGSYKEVPYQGRTSREIMGELGKTLENLFGEDYLLRRALSLPWIYEGKKIVIDGLRRNQALYFDGKVVEVLNPRVPVAEFDFDFYNKEKIAYSIDNSGSLIKLSEEIDLMLENLNDK